LRIRKAPIRKWRLKSSILMTLNMEILSNNITATTVSVVIPLYNKGKYIERALRSVSVQTHQPLEIIVVDDGSTDDGAERVSNFDNSKITLIKQQNSGPGAARNAGLAIARGKYISFLDADDEWMHSFLEQGLSRLEEAGESPAVIFTNYLIQKEGSVSEALCGRLREGVYEVTTETPLEIVMNLIIFSCVCTMIARTDVIRRWGGFFARYRCTRGEDKHLFYKLIFNEKVGIIDERLAVYHTESSDLYGGGTIRKFEVEPYIDNEEDIMDACTEDKRDLLTRLLATMTLSTVKTLALSGQKLDAKMLMNYIYQKERWKTFRSDRMRILVELSPFLPSLSMLWRLIRGKK